MDKLFFNYFALWSFHFVLFQNKVYEEVYSIFGDSDREVTVEDINQMVYLEMVLKETLRRFPVGPLFLRQVKEDIELSK